MNLRRMTLAALAAAALTLADAATAFALPLSALPDAGTVSQRARHGHA